MSTPPNPPPLPLANWLFAAPGRIRQLSDVRRNVNAAFAWFDTAERVPAATPEAR